MTTITVPLVGAHFRPPAKQVLSSLKAGTPLMLIPDPENPYDPYAIKVAVVPQEVIPVHQLDALRASLEGTGCELHELMERDEPLQLGFVAATGGKPAKGGPGNREVAAALEGASPPWMGELAFGLDGSPQVRVHQLSATKQEPGL